MEVSRGRAGAEPKKHRKNIFHYAAPLVAALGIGVIAWHGIAKEKRDEQPTPSARAVKKEDGENKKIQPTKKQKETFGRLLLLAKVLKENEGNREQGERNEPKYDGEELVAGKDDEQEARNDEGSEVQPLKPILRKAPVFVAEDKEQKSESDDESDFEPIAEGQESEADDESDFSWPERYIAEGQVFGQGESVDLSIDYDEYSGPSMITSITSEGVELEAVGENESRKVRIGFGEPFQLSLSFVVEMAGYMSFPMEFVNSDTGVKIVPSCKGTLHMEIFMSETSGGKYPFCEE